MILIGLFVLILLIALLGYMETSKIQSRLEKISYQMTKQLEKCGARQPIAPSAPSNPSNSSNPTRDSVERFMQRQEQQEQQEEQEGEQVEQQEEQSNNNAHLSESQQEFSAEVPESQSAFSLGAIFNNLDATGTGQIEELDDDELDKIASDSEYSDEDDYSSGSGSEEPEDTKLKKELEKKFFQKYTEQDIELLSLVKLRELCIDNKISKHGNKQALINKLLKL